jgi:hypothetical protein
VEVHEAPHALASVRLEVRTPRAVAALAAAAFGKTSTSVHARVHRSREAFPESLRERFVTRDTGGIADEVVLGRTGVDREQAGQQHQSNRESDRVSHQPADFASRQRTRR